MLHRSVSALERIFRKNIENNTSLRAIQSLKRGLTNWNLVDVRIWHQFTRIIIVADFKTKSWENLSYESALGALAQFLYAHPLPLNIALLQMLEESPGRWEVSAPRFQGVRGKEGWGGQTHAQRGTLKLFSFFHHPHACFQCGLLLVEIIHKK